MEYYSIKYSDSFLEHHGILGQKWGKRNGPPYPLDESDHSVAEQKAEKERFHLTEQQKKYLKIGAAVAVAGLATYGIVKYSKAKSAKNIGKVVDFNTAAAKIKAKDLEGLTEDGIPLTNLYGNAKKPIKIGKTKSDIDLKMLSRINSDNANTEGGNINCVHCSLSYVLNSVFGKNTAALPFNGIDEFSGMASKGRDIKVLDSIFNGINHVDTNNQLFSQSVKKIPNGSTGILGLQFSNGTQHAVAYEKTKDGLLTIIDPQKNGLFDYESFIPRLDQELTGNLKILDFSNAEIKQNAEQILKYLVK